jgi:hypothetical protein
VLTGILILLSTAVPARQDAGIETLLVGDRAAYQRVVEMGESAIERLSSILGSDKFDGTTRFMAANALGDIGSKKAVEPLLAALKDPYFNIRRCAALALGKLRDEVEIGPARRFLPAIPLTRRSWKRASRKYERFFMQSGHPGPGAPSVQFRPASRLLRGGPPWNASESAPRLRSSAGSCALLRRRRSPSA